MNGQGDSGWTLRSQEFVADRSQEANQWRNVAAQAAMDTGRTIVPQMQAISQRAERHQMDMLAAQSEIGLREIQKQDAAQQLQWVQALHQTDMLGATKERAKLENRLLAVQVEDREEARKSREFDRQFGMDVQEAMAFGPHLSGKVYDPGTRKMRDATGDEKTASAQKYAGSRYARTQRQEDPFDEELRRRMEEKRSGTTNGAAPAAAPTAAPPDPHLSAFRRVIEPFKASGLNDQMAQAAWPLIRADVLATAKRVVDAANAAGKPLSMEDAVAQLLAGRFAGEIGAQRLAEYVQRGSGQ